MNNNRTNIIRTKIGLATLEKYSVDQSSITTLPVIVQHDPSFNELEQEDHGLDSINACMIPTDITKMENYSDLKRIFTGDFKSFNLHGQINENINISHCAQKVNLINLPGSEFNKRQNTFLFQTCR